MDIGSKIEEHTTPIYTRNIFLVFSCFDPQDSFVATMEFNSNVAKCTCQLYEFMDILSQHIMVISQSSKKCSNSKSPHFTMLGQRN